ncbi:hypothetical protein E4U13_000436 [Claviceps humidiphila]|uniref:Uncharacterized protein n=1 Tax=Claviceps humidiphila TaxID=1294629 RepID=A0A9P7TVX7_9HYPO|nr:hypothetical protein E4U13_000436 [Claviceps humidiphila]
MIRNRFHTLKNVVAPSASIRSSPTLSLRAEPSGFCCCWFIDLFILFSMSTARWDRCPLPSLWQDLVSGAEAIKVAQEARRDLAGVSDKDHWRRHSPRLKPQSAKLSEASDRTARSIMTGG